MGFLIGDLVPINDKYWELYLCIREILDIILKISVDSDDIHLLKVLIEEHHQMYLLLSKEKLKPKFHMIHYPNILQPIGPLINISSMRYESKQKEFKATSYVIYSRKKIAYSLAFRPAKTMF